MFSLDSALRAGLRLAHEERDGAELHVADLAKCPREVWARRNGKPKVNPSPETLMKWRYGHLIEKEVVDLIRPIVEKDGWTLVHGGEVSYEHDGVEIAGHPDIRLYHHGRKELVVLDVKTTTFYPTKEPAGWANGKQQYKRVRKPDTSPRDQYCIQTNGYAVIEAMRPGHRPYAVRWGVGVLCRESGMFTDFGQLHEPDPESFHLLMRQYDELTRPGAPIPAPIPPDFTYRNDGTSWAHAYCGAADCELNANSDALVLL